MAEHYLGIDVGHSKSRPTTGLCLITIRHSHFLWRCCNTGTQESQRLEDIRRMVPAGATLAAVGIDGPLASNLDFVNCHRAADSLLTRGCFQFRCKPGSTKSRRGQPLHRHATKLANLVIGLRDNGCLHLSNASHPEPVHQSRIVEAFPTAFLAFLIPENLEEDFPSGKLERTKSDAFYKIAVREGYLRHLIKTLAPQSNLDHCLNSIKNHDHRAAFVCALAALCAAKNKYVAVGDPKHGYIFLPPSEVWGLESGSQSCWAETTLRQNMVAVRKNRNKRPTYDQVRAFRNGEQWL